MLQCQRASWIPISVLQWEEWGWWCPWTFLVTATSSHGYLVFLIIQWLANALADFWIDLLGFMFYGCLTRFSLFQNSSFTLISWTWVHKLRPSKAFGKRGSVTAKVCEVHDIMPVENSGRFCRDFIYLEHQGKNASEKNCATSLLSIPKRNSRWAFPGN